MEVFYIIPPIYLRVKGDLMSDYDDLLNVCIQKLPKECKDGERFCIPKADVLIQGARTIFLNFYDVANALRRDPKHLLKFFLKELATSYEEKDKKVTFQGRFPGVLMDKKIELYVKNYVLCPNCCKPDTKLMKIDRIDVLKCEACGSRQAVKRIK
jgi:translation initiation factor 2 subunit 2